MGRDQYNDKFTESQRFRSVIPNIETQKLSETGAKQNKGAICQHNPIRIDTEPYLDDKVQLDGVPCSTDYQVFAKPDFISFQLTISPKIQLRCDKFD